MFILQYNGNKAAVVINGNYIYEFVSKEEAKSKIDQAEKIFVAYPHRGQELDMSVAVKQQLKVKDDGYSYDEL